MPECNRLLTRFANSLLSLVALMKKFLSFLVAVVLGCSILEVHAETLVALMSDKTLRYFEAGFPNAQTWLKTVAIAGIPDTESVEAMDFRPNGPLVVIAREGNTLRRRTPSMRTPAQPRHRAW